MNILARTLAEPSTCIVSKPA